MNPFHNNKLIIFQTDYSHTWLPFELIPFLFIGAIGGLLGTLFIRLNIRWCTFRRTSQLKYYPVTEVLFIAFITCAVSYLNVYMRYVVRDIYTINSTAVTFCCSRCFALRRLTNGTYG
jgi:chloride channel 3/4/5